MRVLEIGNAGVNLLDQVAPFQPNYSVVVQNTAAEQRVLQEADDAAFTTPTTLATLAAAGVSGSIQNVTFNKQYVRVSTGGGDVLFAIGN